MTQTRRSNRFIALGIVAFVALPSRSLVAATKYLALEPGVSTKVDAARALGEPVFSMGDILLEYAARGGTGAIFVELRTSGEIVDRIEVRMPPNTTRPALAALVALPAAPNATRKDRAGALLEYYGNGNALMVAYTGADASSTVASVTYYSDAAFAKQIEIVDATANTPTPPTPPTAPDTPTPPTAPGPGSFPGAATAPAEPPPPPVPPVNAIAPTVARDPLACYALFTWSRAEEEDAKRVKQTERRQLAMDIRISSQAGDCDRAKQLSNRYKRLYPGRGIK